jgi:hypothetical protein
MQYKNKSFALGMIILAIIGLNLITLATSSPNIIMASSNKTYHYVFNDDFESGSLSINCSVSGSGVGGVNTYTSNSGTNSAYHADGAGEITTTTFDLSSYDFANITCWVQRGEDSFSENPENGENLVVEYYNKVGGWTILTTHPGSTAGGQYILIMENLLSSNSLHSSFRLRFRQTAGGGGGVNDWWHFDDVKIIGIRESDDSGDDDDDENGKEDLDIIESIEDMNEDQLLAVLGIIGLFIFYKLDRKLIKLKKMG